MIRGKKYIKDLLAHGVSVLVEVPEGTRTRSCYVKCNDFFCSTYLSGYLEVHILALNLERCKYVTVRSFKAHGY